MPFIGTDDYAIAAETARTLFKAMGGKGNLVVLEGPDNVPTAVARLRGFKDALKDFPNIKVTLSKNGMYARPPVLDLFNSMLKLNPPPQVDGVLAANDAMAFGAIEAFKAANKPLPPIVGINASKEAVDFIKAGDMLASGDYNGLDRGLPGRRDRHPHAPQAAGSQGNPGEDLRGRQIERARPTRSPSSGGPVRRWRAPARCKELHRPLARCRPRCAHDSVL